MGDLHEPDQEVITATSAHLSVVRAQLYTVTPNWEGSWEL